MSKKKPVMSHDPLADLAEDDSGDTQQAAAAAPQARDIMTPDAGSDDGAVSLGATLTVAEVSECQAELERRMIAADALRVDGTELEIVDGAGMQLVAAFVREARKRDLPLQWLGRSEQLDRAAATLGLSELFDETGPGS